MFELIDYKPEHAIDIVKKGIRQPNLKFCDETQPWAESLAQHPAKTGVYDGRIVGCGGLIILMERHRAEAWITPVSDIGNLQIDPQIIRNQLYDWILEYELVRIEAPLREDFAAGFSYAKYLGFKPEAKLEKYHTDGTDAYMHVIINEGK